MSDLTPTQSLIGDVLAARARTGESMWTFDTRLRKSAEFMAAMGLVTVHHGIVEKTFRASLTELGKIRFISEKYVPPMDKGGARARHVRNAEGFLQKAALAASQQEFDNHIRMADVYASLAMAEDGDR